jgi:NADPH:quinone reductase-like Zn-dependent oxidoreductase
VREATKLIEAGKIVPRLDPRHFSLDTIEQAHAAIEGGTATGKIVVDIGA